VGAGPAGSTAARRLAEKGHTVTVIEEHPRVGEPVQCAGLVSQRVLDLAGGTSFVRSSVRGASVFGPSLASIEFKADRPRAFVVDRGGLDRFLADRATSAGAQLQTSTTFRRRVGVRDGREVLELKGPDGSSREIAARAVVGADGVSSAVARAFRLRRPVEFLPAFEAEFAQSPGDPESVEVYLGRALAPGLFGWWIPDGAGGARVGVAVDADGTPARDYYLRLVDQISRRFGTPLSGAATYLVSGIPIGNVPATSAEHVVLVGDAAAQVKPLSGGGIFTGMRCAEIAADVLDRALRSNDLTGASLAEYDRRWRAEFGEEFRRALHLRRVLARLTDRDLDAVVDALRAGRLAPTIVAFGDIDYPTHVARELLRESPRLVRLLPKALGAWFGSPDYRAPPLDFASRR
jgi:geranylgeranyl reductase family protein